MRSTHTTCLHITAQSPQARKLKNFKFCTHLITITTMSQHWGIFELVKVFTHHNRVYTPIHKGIFEKVQSLYVLQCRDLIHTRGTVLKFSKSLHTTAQSSHPCGGSLKFNKVFTHPSTHIQGEHVPHRDFFKKKSLQHRNLDGAVLRCRAKLL